MTQFKVLKIVCIHRPTRRQNISAFFLVFKPDFQCVLFISSEAYLLNWEVLTTCNDESTQRLYGVVASMMSLEKASLRKLHLKGRCMGQLSIMGTIYPRELSFKEGRFILSLVMGWLYCIWVCREVPECGGNVWPKKVFVSWQQRKKEGDMKESRMQYPPQGPGAHPMTWISHIRSHLPYHQSLWEEASTHGPLGKIQVQTVRMAECFIHTKYQKKIGI